MSDAGQSKAKKIEPWQADILEAQGKISKETADAIRSSAKDKFSLDTSSALTTAAAMSPIIGGTAKLGYETYKYLGELENNRNQAVSESINDNAAVAEQAERIKSAVARENASVSPQVQSYGGSDYGLGGISNSMAASANRVAGAGEGVKKAVESSAGAAARGADTEYEAQLNRAAEVGRQRAERDEAVRSYDEAVAQKEQGRMAARHTIMRDIDNTMEEIKNFEIKDRISTGRKVASVVAAAIAGIGAALTGQRNAAIDIIQANIDRDIDAQREQLRGKQLQLQAKTNQLGYLRDLYKDERVADDALHLRMLDKYETAIKETIATPSSAEIAAKRDKALADIVMQKEETKLKIVDSVEKARMQSLGQQANIAVAQGEQDAKNTATAMKYAKEMGAKEIPGLSRIPGYNPTDDDVKKAKEKIAAAEDFIAKINSLIDINKEAGFLGYELWNRDLVSRGNSAFASAVSAYKNAEALGALDKGALKLGQEAIGGNPTGGPFAVGTYADLIRRTREGLKITLKPHGYTPELSSSSDIAKQYGGKAAE